MEIELPRSEQQSRREIGAAPLDRLKQRGLLSIELKDVASETTLSANVYGNLREALLSGILAPGDLLSIRPLAAALGTSTMPVREALSRLTTEGALETLPNRAYRVPRVSAAQFRELCLIRLRLESLACEHAAVRASAADIETIRQLLDTLVSTSSRPGLDYLIAHRHFHFGIYAIAGLPFLFSSIETLWLRMGPILHAAARHADLDEETRAHRELFFALQRGDPSEAARAIDNDLRHAGDRTIRYLSMDAI